MRCWGGMLRMVAVAAAVATVGVGCGSASAPRKDAGGQRDGAVSTGGALATGGSIGVGGATGAGGDRTGGASGAGTGGWHGTGGSATIPGQGGSGTGGRTVGGAGGGGGGTMAGGAGGTTGKDASSDGVPDAPGGDGQPTVLYSGCGYMGDIERAVVAKYDAATAMCVTMVMESPARPDAGFTLTINANWGVVALFMWPASPGHCATRVVPTGAVNAIAARGTVTVNRSPTTVDVDAIVEFPANDSGAPQSVAMSAQGVDWNQSCSVP